jgi:hypothetical protein
VILGWWNAGASINESGILFEWGVTQWLSTKLIWSKQRISKS